jgi:hypothetical protein
MFELFPFEGRKLVGWLETDNQNTSWDFPRHHRFLILALRWFERSIKNDVLLLDPQK